jgi:hypothetical protein
VTAAIVISFHSVTASAETDPAHIASAHTTVRAVLFSRFIFVSSELITTFAARVRFT